LSRTRRSGFATIGLVVAAALLTGCAAGPAPRRSPADSDAGRTDGLRDDDVMTVPLDSRAVADEIVLAKATTPMPAAATYRPIALDPGGSYGRGSGRSMVEFQAACAWFDAALGAHADGAVESSTRAMAVVAEIPRWWTFSDPSVADRTLVALVSDVVAGAERGDLAPMGRFVELNCR
jgi:hypothetical protein